MDRLNFRTENFPGQLSKRSRSSMPLGSIEALQGASTPLQLIDDVDASNTQRLGYYAREIYENLLSSEYIFPSDFLENQPHIDHKMRAILVDWIVTVHLKFRLLPETLYLSVHLVDRYLERVSIQKKHLQLVGIASMLIAAKYEEIYPPHTRDFIACTDHIYTKQQLLKMENDMLKVLEFNITVPSIYRFLERYSRVGNVPANVFFLAKFISQLGLIEHKIVKYKASLIAASSLYLAVKILRIEHLWSPLEELGNCPHFKLCVKDLFFLLQVAHNHPLTAVRDKFARTEFHEVSKIRLSEA